MKFSSVPAWSFSSKKFQTLKSSSLYFHEQKKDQLSKKVSITIKRDNTSPNKQSLQNPGPGSYQLKLSEPTPIFLRGKPKEPSPQNTPGPGSYDLLLTHKSQSIFSLNLSESQKTPEKKGVKNQKETSGKKLGSQSARLSLPNPSINKDPALFRQSSVNQNKKILSQNQKFNLAKEIMKPVFSSRKPTDKKLRLQETNRNFLTGRVQNQQIEEQIIEGDSHQSIPQQRIQVSKVNITKKKKIRKSFQHIRNNSCKYLIPKSSVLVKQLKNYSFALHPQKHPDLDILQAGGNLFQKYPYRVKFKNPNINYQQSRRVSGFSDTPGPGSYNIKQSIPDIPYYSSYFNHQLQ